MPHASNIVFCDGPDIQCHCGEMTSVSFDATVRLSDCVSWSFERLKEATSTNDQQTRHTCCGIVAPRNA